jgi:hypothetical protein
VLPQMSRTGLTFSIIITLSLLLSSGNALASTSYYVDYTNGSDNNPGTSKTAPWKYAPGMNGASRQAASTQINPGDSIILKGCVTWPNGVFPWAPTASGTSGNPIYIGVDKTWWDSTVRGCSSAWNRPILNPQGETTDPANTGLENLVNLTHVSYVTVDNFEIVNWYTFPDTTSGSHEAHVFYVSSAQYGASYITVENMYVHGWINPFISIGTGNITSGSCQITNYVPYSYSPSPSSSWTSAPGGVLLQALPQGTDIPEGNNSPVVTAITGSNPYTITFTNTAGCPTGNHTGDVIQIGNDSGIIVAGNSAGDTGTVVQDNVFDGSDTAEVAWNPYGDCGASEGNNQACLASVEVGRQGPQIWRNNVIRYVSNGFVGTTNELSGNLIEYVRLGINPTGHTNVWESFDPAITSPTLFYNNVIRHMNSVNSSIPGGFWNVGMPLLAATSASGTTYIFNNVLYDMTQNTAIELSGATYAVNVFNNTVQTGPSTGVSYEAFKCTATTCNVENNYAVTTNSTPFGTCGSGCTRTTNLSQTPTVANNQGYIASATYAFSPTGSGGGTVGAGTNLQSRCAAISAASAAAGTACQSDTVYAVSYNASTHTVIVRDRTPNTRPATGAWDVGAYLFGAGGSGPQPPTGLTTVVH